MISELLNLADRLSFPSPKAFDQLPVHYLIDLDIEGQLLGITPAYGSTPQKKGEPKLGKLMECPVYFPLSIGKNDKLQAAGGGGKSVAEAGHGDIREIFCSNIKLPNNKPPVIEELQPPADNKNQIPEENEESYESDDSIDTEEFNDDEEENANSRQKQYYRYTNWWKLIKEFKEYAESKKDASHAKALLEFESKKYRLTDDNILSHFHLPDPEKKEDLSRSEEERNKAKSDATKKRNSTLKVIANARFTFRIDGEILIHNTLFKEWWQKAYTDKRSKIIEKLPEGYDSFSKAVDEDRKRLTPVFPHIPNIPEGGMYCPLASFDKATTKSYGLGKFTVSMSLYTSERAASALKWLLREPSSHCKLGDKLVAVFWAKPTGTQSNLPPLDFITALQEPDALQVREFFNNIHGHTAMAPAPAQFYCAILSSPKSRITVRSWHMETIAKVSDAVSRYFQAISLPDAFHSYVKTANKISDMVATTVSPKSKTSPPPELYSKVFQTALFAIPLPHSVLETIITRQCAEFAKGKSDDDKGDFESRLRARTALIKLYFSSNDKNKGNPMNEITHESHNHPAYLCGRVLAVLDKIHNAAHNKSTSSSPAGRYYGAASSTPALVFPRLCKLARIHLEKLDNRGWAYNLDKSLSTLVAQFNEKAKWPRTLSLEDQGRFAIGFYYERNLHNTIQTEPASLDSEQDEETDTEPQSQTIE